MSENNDIVKKYGKFKYIEPNDILEHELYPERAQGARSYNITHPYEDYSIDVELEVKIPRRGVWNNSFHDTESSMSVSKVGTENFFGGTNGYLTNSPGSMTYKDILNNEADRESLGITNIHITYNSYFVPEITINFTDIRGMGLFMSHEEDYRLNRQTKGTVGVEKFFAALFTFPYPEFTLKVKGFYGKRVSYSLVVSDFKSSFNNQTGNFDATVKFIGKMYGVYTDIPMTYLMVAPYCKYGISNNKTVWEDGDFTWKDENGNTLLDESGKVKRMPTLIELKQKILGANEQIKVVANGDIISGYQSIFIKKQLLHEITVAYNNFTQYLTSFPSVISDGKKIFLCKGEGSGYNTTFTYLYPDDNSNRGKLINLTQTLYDKILAFNNTVSDNTLPFIVPFDTRGAKIDSRNCFVRFKINKGQIDGDLNFDNDYGINFQIENYTSIKNQLQHLTDGDYSFFVVNAENFVKTLSDLEETNNTELQTAKNDITERINILYEKHLGFAPTIKNIFTIVLAHLQAFLTVFQKCINNINSDTTRTIKSKNLNSTLLPDIPSWVTNDFHLPPFPSLKNNTSNSFVYPTEIKNVNLEEDTFINYLFVGASDTIAQNEILNKHSDAKENTNQFFIPTCITDYNCYRYTNPNPYYYAFKDNSNIQTLDWLFTFFGYRCSQKFLLEHSQDPGVGTDSTALFNQGFRKDDVLLTAEEFGKYEAYNFWLAHPILAKDIYDALQTGSQITSSNFINFITNEFSFDSNNGIPPTTWDKKFIADSYGASLKVFNLNNNTGYPARLCHGGKYSTQYNSDKTDFGYSFRGGGSGKTEWSITGQSISNYNDDNELMDGTTTLMGGFLNTQYYETIPYRLIIPIEASKLKTWQKSLSEIDSNVINCDKHNNLIQQYIDNSYHQWYHSSENQNSTNATFESYVKNPSYNVLFQDGEVGMFFEKHSRENHFYKRYLTDDSKLHPCNYIKENDSSSLIVHSMHSRLGDAIPTSRKIQGYTVSNVERKRKDNVPIFFHPNLTAGDFLSSIPHNLEGLTKMLRDGRRIVKMPYTTKLFIGYIIDSIQNKNFTELRDFFRKVTDFSKAMLYDNYYINGSHKTDSSGTNYYLATIYILLSYLTCNNEKKFHSLPSSWDSQNGNEVVYGVPVSRTNVEIGDHNISNGKHRSLASIYWAKEKGLFSNDIFKFAEEYRSWKDSSSDSFKTISDNGSNIKIPGFMWLKNNMSLKENSNFTLKIGNVEIKLSKETQYERLLELIQNEQVQTWLRTLSNNGKSLTVNATANENPLNHYYKHYDNSEESQSATAFGDIYCSIQYTEGTSVNLQFNPEWKGTQLLNNLLKYISYFVYPYSRNPKYSNQNLQASKNLFITAFNSFTNTIKTLCTSDNPVAGVTISNIDSKIPIEQKLSMYRTLKNLYDKHFTDLDTVIDTYNIFNTDKNAEINRFHFIDTYYEDLGDKLLINTDTLINLINTAIDTYGNGGDNISTDLSLYSFLSLICQKHNMLFISMPIFNGSITEDDGENNFKAMFKPLPKNNSDTLKGPSYICFYPHQASQHLDIPISQYRNDSFLITDVNNTDNFEGPTTINGLKEGDGKYTIPAFGVEYATQKQSIFTNINVNMDNPQITEAAVAIQFGIANEKNANTKRLTTDGQDLFKIYSNYSYTCQVEMMGCAQIQPLMYFQLNNIPMFRGAYQIINVEHDITPGNMTTVFKGVRINKTNIPMTSQMVTFDFESISNYIQTNQNVNLLPPLTLRNFGVTHVSNMANHNESGINLNSLIGESSSVKSYIKFENDTIKNGFNNLNPSLRQLIYCILLDIKDINEQNMLDYQLGIIITSSVRRSNSNSTSDHEISSTNNTCSPNAERFNRKGKTINNDGTLGPEKNYSQMGCAIDFSATANGQKDKAMPSMLLYYHILQNYYTYIRQFIWEVENGLSKQNSISHTIHLSSYGEASTSLPCDIFMAQDNGHETIRGRDKWSESFTTVHNNLPQHNGLIRNLSV